MKEPCKPSSCKGNNQDDFIILQQSAMVLVFVEGNNKIRPLHERPAKSACQEPSLAHLGDRILQVEHLIVMPKILQFAGYSLTVKLNTSYTALILQASIASRDWQVVGFVCGLIVLHRKVADGV